MRRRPHFSTPAFSASHQGTERRRQSRPSHGWQPAAPARSLFPRCRTGKQRFELPVFGHALLQDSGKFRKLPFIQQKQPLIKQDVFRLFAGRLKNEVRPALVLGSGGLMLIGAFRASVCMAFLLAVYTFNIQRAAAYVKPWACGASEASFCNFQPICGEYGGERKKQRGIDFCATLRMIRGN